MKTKILEGKVVLITGGGRGIGAAAARLFVAEGAKVIIVSRTQEELEKTAGDIEAEGGQGKVLAIPGDVSDEATVKHIFEKTETVFGPIDILINNAAILEISNFMDMKAKDWDRVLAVNLRGPFLCSREAFRQMKSAGRGGVIINMSSLAGIRGTEKFKGLSSYVVSKHGIVGLTESLAVEGKEWGIRVHCVAPGAVDTAMLKKGASFLKTKTTPLDIARTLLFLCDDNQSRYTTGTVIEMHTNES